MSAFFIPAIAINLDSVERIFRPFNNTGGNRSGQTIPIKTAFIIESICLLCFEGFDLWLYF